jgi:hypothetical protein
MPSSCKSRNLSAVKPTINFYDSVFKENAPPGLNLITVFSKKKIPPWPRIQERLELFPGLSNGVQNVIFHIRCSFKIIIQ